MSLLTLPQRVLNYGQPVNQTAPLNRGLLGWWLTLPQRGKGNTWFDLCGKNHGTLTNGPTWGGAQGRPGGWGALSFDGTNDYVSAPISQSPTTGIGWFAWLYPRSTAESYATFGSVSTTSRLQIGFLDTTGRLYFAAHIGGVFTDNNTATTALTANAWTHVGFIYTGASCFFTVNGVAEGAKAKSGALALSSTDWLFGKYATGINCECVLDDIRIYSFGPDEAFAKQLYQASLRGYPDELNYYRRQYIFDVGAGGGGGGVVPALDQGMLTGGLSTLCGGLA